MFLKINHTKSPTNQ